MCTWLRQGVIGVMTARLLSGGMGMFALQWQVGRETALWLQGVTPPHPHAGGSRKTCNAIVCAYTPAIPCPRQEWRVRHPGRMP